MPSETPRPNGDCNNSGSTSSGGGGSNSSTLRNSTTTAAVTVVVEEADDNEMQPLNNGGQQHNLPVPHKQRRPHRIRFSRHDSVKAKRGSVVSAMAAAGEDSTGNGNSGGGYGRRLSLNFRRFSHVSHQAGIKLFNKNGGGGGGGESGTAAAAASAAAEDPMDEMLRIQNTRLQEKIKKQSRTHSLLVSIVVVFALSWFPLNLLNIVLDIVTIEVGIRL